MFGMVYESNNKTNNKIGYRITKVLYFPPPQRQYNFINKQYENKLKLIDLRFI